MYKYLEMNNDKFIIILLSVTAVIDTLNGFILDILPNTIISVGMGFRALLIIYIISLMYKYKKELKIVEKLRNIKKIEQIKELLFSNSFFKYIVLMVLITIYLLINITVSFLYHNRITVFINDLIMVSKLLMPMFIIIVTGVLYSLKKIKKEDVNVIIYFNIIYVPISLIILKVFNLGLNAYEKGTGFKGYYYSNNELNIVLCILFIFAWENLHKKNKTINTKKLITNILILIYVLIPLILVGSKTSFIAILLITTIYSIVILKNTIKPLRNTLVMIFLIISLGLLFFSIFRQDISDIIERQLHFYGNRDFITYVLSDRNILLQNLWNKIKGQSNIFTFLFGYRGSIINNSTFLSIELDIIAIFFNYGLVGVVLIYYFYLSILITAIKNKHLDLFPFIMAVIFTLAFSTLAGHVMFGAFAGTFMAIVFIPIMMDAIESEHS